MLLANGRAFESHPRSGQDRFALNQTYLGRRPDQLYAVGSYSSGVAMEFAFDGASSLLSTCRHVFRETIRNMAAADKVANATLFSNVSFELNDLRPLPRRSSLPDSDSDSLVVLCDLFFMLNEYLDGFEAVLLYDVSMFEEADAELLLQDWWRALERVEALGELDESDCGSGDGCSVEGGGAEERPPE